MEDNIKSQIARVIMRHLHAEPNKRHYRLSTLGLNATIADIAALFEQQEIAASRDVISLLNRGFNPLNEQSGEKWKREIGTQQPGPFSLKQDS